VPGTVIAVYILYESCNKLHDISEVPLREIQTIVSSLHKNDASATSC